jgi:DNA-binding NarL/FixJ family response regulator
VLLADDQALFREGIATLLSVHPDLEVVGEAADGASALAQVGELRPDVVLMDLRMPVLGGVGATRRITERHPEVRVLVLTTFDDDEEIFPALRAGATGYLLKDCPSSELADAIRAAARGDAVLHPSVAAKVIAELNRRPVRSGDANADLPEPLSARELEVLRALAAGGANREIARQLGLAEGTVKNHVTTILAKLDVPDRTRAALRARDLGLL